MDRAYVGPFVAPDEDISAGARKYIDQIEASLTATGRLGLTGYEYAVTRSTFQVGNGMQYDDYSGITLNPIEAEALRDLIEGWLEWRKSMG